MLFVHNISRSTHSLHHSSSETSPHRSRSGSCDKRKKIEAYVGIPKSSDFAIEGFECSGLSADFGNRRRYSEIPRFDIKKREKERDQLKPHLSSRRKSDISDMAHCRASPKICVTDERGSVTTSALQIQCSNKKIKPPKSPGRSESSGSGSSKGKKKRSNPKGELNQDSKSTPLHQPNSKTSAQEKENLTDENGAYLSVPGGCPKVQDQQVEVVKNGKYTIFVTNFCKRGKSLLSKVSRSKKDDDSDPKMNEKNILTP